MLDVSTKVQAGSMWRSYTAFFAIPSPKGASYRTGKIEQYIQMIKQAFVAVSSELRWNADLDIRLSLSVFHIILPLGPNRWSLQSHHLGAGRIFQRR